MIVVVMLVTMGRLVLSLMEMIVAVMLVTMGRLVLGRLVLLPWQSWSNNYQESIL
jgi:hypothetical protein